MKKATTGVNDKIKVAVNNRKKTPASWKKGKSGNPDGRPKGAYGSFTDLKKAFLEVFSQGNGYGDGVKWLANWARENETEFFKILAKLLPKEVEVSSKQTPREQLDALMYGGEG